MDFGLSDEQRLLQDTFRNYLADNVPITRVREIATSDGAEARTLWSSLAELGAAGILIPEEHGGSALSHLDAALVAEELGGAVTPVPFVASAVLAPVALREAGTPEQAEGVAAQARYRRPADRCRADRELFPPRGRRGAPSRREARRQSADGAGPARRRPRAHCRRDGRSRAGGDGRSGARGRGSLDHRSHPPRGGAASRVRRTGRASRGTWRSGARSRPRARRGPSSARRGPRSEPASPCSIRLSNTRSSARSSVA